MTAYLLPSVDMFPVWNIAYEKSTRREQAATRLRGRCGVECLLRSPIGN